MAEDNKNKPADYPDGGVISDGRFLPARRLFDSVPCFASVQGPDFRILDVNRAFKETFGDHVGEFCYEAYKQRSSKCPVCSVEKTFADGLVHSSEETVRTKSGETVHMLVQASPILDENERIFVSSHIVEPRPHGFLRWLENRAATCRIDLPRVIHVAELQDRPWTPISRTERSAAV